MNPTTITAKPVVIVSSEVTEKPGQPTNGCSMTISLKRIFFLKDNFLFFTSNEIHF